MGVEDEDNGDATMLLRLKRKKKQKRVSFQSKNMLPQKETQTFSSSLRLDR